MHVNISYFNMSIKLLIIHVHFMGYIFDVNREKHTNKKYKLQTDLYFFAVLQTIT